MSLSLDSVLENFQDIFTTNSTELSFCYHMELGEGTSPIVEPVRRVPFALKAKLRKQTG